MQIPSWVLKPSIDDALAAADCVKYSGNLSIDRQMAVSGARAELADQLLTRVQNMNNTIETRTDDDTSTTTSSVFESLTSQTSNELLVGSKPEAFGFADLNGIQHYCALVSLNTDASRELFDNIINTSQTQFASERQQDLWQAFMADSSTESLEDKIKRLSN